MNHEKDPYGFKQSDCPALNSVIPHESSKSLQDDLVEKDHT